MFHSINSPCCQSVTEVLSRVGDLSALGKEGSLSLGWGISNLEVSLPQGRVTCVQSSCSSGRAQTGPILLVILMEWSTGQLVSIIDRTDLSGLALVSCSVLWLSCTFGFWNHLPKYFSRHLHSLILELGAFQLASSPQGVRQLSQPEPKYGEQSVESATVLHIWRYPIAWKILLAGNVSAFEWDFLFS